MITGDTILLVEDNADDAALFAAAARKARPKATLLTISTGSEAVQYFEGRGKFTDRKRFSPPTMAFIDLALPDLPGEQLIKWIRNQPQFKRLLLAVLTGSADARQLRELYHWGADSFLLKTDDIKELATNLRELTAYWVQRGLIATPPCEAPK